MPIEDTLALRREQETIKSDAKAGIVRTGLVEEKLDEPTQQQTQLGTQGVAYEESLEQSPEDDGHQQQQPEEGSWDSELHDHALQQTQLGTESGFQEAPTTKSDELEQDQPNRQYQTQTPPLPSLQSPRVRRTWNPQMVIRLMRMLRKLLLWLQRKVIGLKCAPTG